MPDPIRSQSSLKARLDLTQRIREGRLERFGEKGIAGLARLLGIPSRTWANYERGVTIPGEVLLAFLVLTDLNPEWLLTGEGERYRPLRPAGSLRLDPQTADSVRRPQDQTA